MLLRTGIVTFVVAVVMALGAAAAVLTSGEARTSSVAALGETTVEQLLRGSPDSGSSTLEATPEREPEREPERASDAAEPPPATAPSQAPAPRPATEPRAASRAKSSESAPNPAREFVPRQSEGGTTQTDNGPEPTPTEIEAANSERRYPPRENAALTLTVDRLGLYGMPVADSREEAALDKGAIHVPETPMPWDERAQKNVYIAGHRLGIPGTNSRLAFYHLDKLEGGDKITLKDKAGNAYRYEVTEVFEVDPSDVWVMDTVRDRDIVTLQTCAPIPTFEKRLIVRADRI